MASRAASVRALLTLPALLLGVPACFGGEGSVSGAASITLISVEPRSFLGETICGSYPGAMRSYVATITDTSVDPPFRLASSEPVPCHQAASFAFVVPGHAYIAEIEGYERTDLVPLGGRRSGSQVMLDPKTRERVAPAWRAECGSAGESATLSEAFRNIAIQNCSQLERAEPAEGASISIDPTQLLDGRGCGDQEGEISRFEIQGGEAGTKEAGCEEAVVFEVEPNRQYTFEVTAFETGASEPRFFARCQIESRAGMSLPARCAPLSSYGTARLHIEELLQARGHACSPEDIEIYDVIVDGRVALANAPCRKDAIIGPLEPGDHELSVVALGRESGKLAPKLQARCGAITIVAAQEIEASCAP